MITKEAIEAACAVLNERDKGNAINIPDVVAVMTDIVERLRLTTEQMANNCSVNMTLWCEHSGAALEAASEIELLRLSLSEARATGRREGMEAMTDALRDDALAKRAADFLLERDQQTTQDERDDGERETSAFIILQMGAAAIRAAMEK